ncbi:MAG: glycosyltransferase family 4 protein [Candidatus Heimdallarchaeota archaeon]
MKIAFIGTFGVPPRYGGQEACVDAISRELKKRGHAVTVYGSFAKKGFLFENGTYKGIRTLNMRHFRFMPLDFLIRRQLSVIHSIKEHFDVVHLFGIETVVFAPILRFLGTKTVVTIDGLEWNRESYSPLVRFIIRMVVKLPLILTNACIIDSKYIQELFSRAYQKKPVFIPNGTHYASQTWKIFKARDDILQKYDLLCNEYVLFVGRLVNEKRIHILIEAFSKIKTNLKLAIVGNDPFGDDYYKFLQSLASDNVAFLGSIFGSDLDHILAGSYFYITASEIEGSSPAIIAAMGMGKAVIVSGTPQNREVVGPEGALFSPGNVQELQGIISDLLSSPKKVKELGHSMRERAEQLFSWDGIVDQLESLYYEISNMTN